MRLPQIAVGDGSRRVLGYFLGEIHMQQRGVTYKQQHQLPSIDTAECTEPVKWLAVYAALSIIHGYYVTCPSMGVCISFLTLFYYNYQ